MYTQKLFGAGVGLRLGFTLPGVGCGAGVLPGTGTCVTPGAGVGTPLGNGVGLTKSQ